MWSVFHCCFYFTNFSFSLLYEILFYFLELSQLYSTIFQFSHPSSEVLTLCITFCATFYNLILSAITWNLIRNNELFCKQNDSTCLICRTGSYLPFQCPYKTVLGLHTLHMASVFSFGSRHRFTLNKTYQIKRVRTQIKDMIPFKVSVSDNSMFFENKKQTNLNLHKQSTSFTIRLRIRLKNIAGAMMITDIRR